MKHFQLPKTKENLTTLLRQYQEYNKATTEEEKNYIGDSMTYADPVVWIMYKHMAYMNSHYAIKTLGDLMEHSQDHGGICFKRFNFLSNYIKKMYSKNILNQKEFSKDMPIEDFYSSDILDKVVSEDGFIHDWQMYEYYKKDGKVAKWQNYIFTN